MKHSETKWRTPSNDKISEAMSLHPFLQSNSGAHKGSCQSMVYRSVGKRVYGIMGNYISSWHWFWHSPISTPFFVYITFNAMRMLQWLYVFFWGCKKLSNTLSRKTKKKVTYKVRKKFDFANAMQFGVIF